MALQHLSNARPKLVEDVYPGVAANGGTEIFERGRSGPRPIGTISSGDGRRSQHSQEIRRVHCFVSGVVAGDQNARGGVGGPTHNAVAGRRVITWVLPEQHGIQVFAKENARLLLKYRRPIK